MKLLLKYPFQVDDLYGYNQTLHEFFLFYLDKYLLLHQLLLQHLILQSVDRHDSSLPLRYLDLILFQILLEHLFSFQVSSCQADLDEEVARFYGYDKIPVTLPSGEAMTGTLSFKLRLESMARDLAQQFGFSEAQTYSFESPKVFDKLLLEPNDPLRQTIVISNPLGEDYSIMRTLPLNGMLSSLATNYNRKICQFCNLWHI